jgi:HSP20 family protein
MRTQKTKYMKPLTSRTFGYPSLYPEIFEAFFTDLPTQLPKANSPAVNIKETEAMYMLEILAPGLTKDDFKLELTQDRLVISGEHKQNQETSNEKYTRKEFTFQSFKRAFNLPENEVDGDAVSAAFENGVLRVTIPKRKHEKASESKLIRIQ